MTIDDVDYVRSIILNGKVGYCDTNDECEHTVGLYTTTKAMMLNGDIEEIIADSFPFSKKMNELLGYDAIISVQMLTGTTPIDMNHINETLIVSMEGEVSHKYYHCYSELTGYLWTEEECKCGGHDLINILKSHFGEYMYMKIDVYKKKRREKR